MPRPGSDGHPARGRSTTPIRRRYRDALSAAPLKAGSAEIREVATAGPKPAAVVFDVITGTAPYGVALTARDDDIKVVLDLA